VVRTLAPSPRGLLLSEYVVSLPRADMPVPGPPLPEIALAGRSNVGKSSLLNLLVGRKALARASRTPGKTRALNVYLWGRCYLVDVPGYGWSQASKTERAGWRRLVERYVAERAALQGVLWLLDARREPSRDDLAFGAVLAARKVPTLVVLTKGDEIPRGRRGERVQAIAEALGMPADDVLVTSARTREGAEELRDAVLAFLG